MSPTVSSRVPVFVLLVLAALFGTCSCAPDRRPNVLLITLDTTRADYLGAYGAADAKTPNFDALAETGTRFDLAIATAGLTPVSHASILTGDFNRDHGLRVLAALGGFRLPSDVPMLSTVLKDAGYQTGAFHSAYPVSAHFGFDRGFDVFESFTATAKTANEKTWDINSLQRRSDQTTDMALDYVSRTKSPFMMWIHYWDPHDSARIPPQEFLPRNLPLHEGRVVSSPELYAAEVRYVDHEFGRLVEGLKKSGQWENTIVVVVADHGEGLGDHGWEFHRILYQEQIRVPLIVRIPNAKQAPSVGALVRTTDIFPTVLDYLGIKAPRPVNGVSLRALMEGRDDPPRMAYADQINGYDLNAKMLENRPLDDFLYCAMDREWKLVYRPTNPDKSELFHIAQDPRELRNLYSAEHAQAQRLLLELARTNPWVTAPFALVADAGDLAAVQQALAGLGYVGSGEPPPDDHRWRWVCPTHSAEQHETRELCSVCRAPPILVLAK
jgi:arylsulfatase A-like enzyme